MLNKDISISLHLFFGPMHTHSSNERPLRGLSKYVYPNPVVTRVFINTLHCCHYDEIRNPMSSNEARIGDVDKAMADDVNTHMMHGTEAMSPFFFLGWWQKLARIET